MLNDNIADIKTRYVLLNLDVKTIQGQYVSTQGSRFVLTNRSIVIATANVNNSYPQGICIADDWTENYTGPKFGLCENTSDAQQLTSVAVMSEGTYYVAVKGKTSHVTSGCRVSVNIIRVFS